MRTVIGAAIDMTRTVAQGPAHPIGSVTWIDNSSVDQTLFWVNSSGVKVGGPQYGPYAAATDVEVKHLANSGPLKLVYLLNDSGGNLQQGNTLQASAATTPFQVSAGDAVNPAEIVGVAPFDVGDDVYFWAFADGIFDVLADGSVTAGAAIEPAAAGTVTDVAATTDSALGWSTETDSGSTLVRARVRCPAAPPG